MTARAASLPASVGDSGKRASATTWRSSAMSMTVSTQTRTASASSSRQDIGASGPDAHSTHADGDHPRHPSPAAGLAGNHGPALVPDGTGSSTPSQVRFLATALHPLRTRPLCQPTGHLRRRSEHNTNQQPEEPSVERPGWPGHNGRRVITAGVSALLGLIAVGCDSTEPRQAGEAAATEDATPTTEVPSTALTIPSTSSTTVE